MRVALLQLAGLPSCAIENPLFFKRLQYRRIFEKVKEQAEKRKADCSAVELLVLPEMWNCPYNLKSFPLFAERIPFAAFSKNDDASVIPEFDLKYLDTQEEMANSETVTCSFLSFLAKKFGFYLLGGSIAEIAYRSATATDGNKIYNSAPVFDSQGKLIAVHRKVHLFDIDVPGGLRFKESEVLSAGNGITTVSLPSATIGVGICYDVRFPEFFQAMREKGVKVIVFPSSFNSTTGPIHWDLLHRARALDTQCYVVACAPILEKKDVEGNDIDVSGEYPAWGHSLVCDPWGEKILDLGGDSPKYEELELDLTKLESVRNSIPVGFQRRSDVYKIHDLTAKEEN